ncbi:hypothetical protein ABZY81_32840 [Streptomyces sp. NPDC006514]|uniref:hypothetical protein n=1 Tax=Streptomyces sp. NPDC006514 TaxID=3154308 RepID=UPI0033AFDB6D
MGPYPWTEPAQPPEVRGSAVLAWLCFVDDPVPHELRTTLDAFVTDDLVDLFDGVPWTAHVDEKGLVRTLAQMLDGAKPGVVDPWDDLSEDLWA